MDPYSSPITSPDNLVGLCPFPLLTCRVRGDLVSRVIILLHHIATLVFPIIKLLTKSP